MAAFPRMHVSPAKHSYAWLPRKCDYRTYTQTDRQTPDKVILMCRFASQATQQKYLVMLLLSLPHAQAGIHNEHKWSTNRQVMERIASTTSILKVLLKQYKSPTGPNKFVRGVTPTNRDQKGLKVEDDVYYFDTNSSKKSLSNKATQRSWENYILAKSNNSSESMLNTTKIVGDL